MYRAHDPVEDRVVAVKRLRAAGSGHRARVRREVAALRLLDLPGVVRILDEGEAEGAPFVVMELVEGRPFPGPVEAGWPGLRGPALGLLETLARVHEAGVVHRDVKPSNVLVRPDGSPVLLDFGLARGHPVGSTITGEGAIVGTPRYLAPEQLRGERVGPAADLYAVGVMLYEALAGRPPHEAAAMDALWQAKLATDPIPLARLAPSVPASVADLVDALLAREPEARPRSAAAALEALGGDGSLGDTLPWLGPRDAVDALVQAALEGRALDLVGAPGSGRSRTLREVAAVLHDRRRVAWTVRATGPFESLAPLLGDPETLVGKGDVPAFVRARVADFLADGVLLVDGIDELDRFSRALLDAASGPVLRTRTTPGSRPCASLRAWTEAELRPLFWGPDRVLLLREDGASELHRRTGGAAAEVAAEVRAWVRAGLARWDGDRLRVDRPGLDRLRSGQRIRPVAAVDAGPLLGLDPPQRHLLAWVQLAGEHASVELLARVTDRPAWQLELELSELRTLGLVETPPHGALRVGLGRDLALSWPGDLRRNAHRRLVGVLPAGARGRLFHMLAGGVLEGLAEEAVQVARDLRVEGRIGEAEACLREALRSLRREGRDTRALHGPVVRTAVAAGTRQALERARYELERSPDVSPRLLLLLDAAIAARAGERVLALQSASELAPFEDADLEFARQATRMQAAQLTGEGAQAVIDDLRTWATLTGDPDVAARVAGWEGLLRYREGAYLEAARLHETSADQRTERLGRLSARLNAAMAWLEAGELDRAEAVAAAVRDDARRERAAGYLARAEWVLRSAASSREAPLSPDLELVEATEALGDEPLLALVATTEAAIAWRAGHPAAADLARRAMRAQASTRNRWGLLFARAVAVASGAEAGVEDDALLAEAALCPVAGVALDLVGALAAAGRLSPAAAELAGRRLADIPPSQRDLRRGLMPPSQVVALVERREGA